MNELRTVPVIQKGYTDTYRVTLDEVHTWLQGYGHILLQYAIPEPFWVPFVRFVEAGELPADGGRFAACLETDSAFQHALEDACVQRVGLLRDAIRALKVGAG